MTKRSFAVATIERQPNEERGGSGYICAMRIDDSLGDFWIDVFPDASPAAMRLEFAGRGKVVPRVNCFGPWVSVLANALDLTTVFDAHGSKSAECDAAELRLCDALAEADQVCTIERFVDMKDAVDRPKKR